MRIKFSNTRWIEVYDPNVGTSNIIDIASPFLAIESTWELSCSVCNYESQNFVISDVRIGVVEKSSYFLYLMNAYPSQTHGV